MTDYSKHAVVLDLLKQSQDADKDNREQYRECEYFMHTPDGQWEPDITQAWKNKPRYTFDLVTGIVDDLAGEIENAEFSLKCLPAGGDATIDLAETYDGLLRDIQVRSDATEIYTDAGRRIVEGGFDAIRVVQDYAPGAVFYQDLWIQGITNAVDCAWFDHNSREQTGRDSRHAFVLQALAKDVYEEKYPEGSGSGISNERWKNVYFNKPDDIVIGELIWLETETTELVLMSNGKVYTVDDDYQKVKDELEQAGITEEQRRTTEVERVKTRLFDGKDFLTPKKDTVFVERIPLVRVAANWAVPEDKPVWRGKVQRLMDPQRVFNMTSSKQVEDAVLAPKRKPWVDRSLLSDPDDLKDAETLNMNAKAVQLYSAEPGKPPPMELGGAQPAPGVSEVNQNMRAILTPQDERLPGQALGARSGVAVEKEQNAQDTKDQKYFSALQKSIREIGKIAVNAIPSVYDTKRTIRLLGEDNVPDMVTIHDVVIDGQTQEPVEKYDLSQGVYDVTCSVGQQFKNKQSEAVAAITEMGQINPALLQIGGDVWLKNAALPGMDLLAERMRAQLISQGVIPPDQLTDEERAQIEQQQAMMANQPPQPDPMMVAAQAEDKKANADLISEQNKQLELQIKAREVEIKAADAETKRIQAETQRQEMEMTVEAQRNKDNAAAMNSAASAHKTMGESGLADQDAAMAGVDAYNEIATDLQMTKGPTMVWDVDAGGLVRG